MDATRHDSDGVDAQALLDMADRLEREAKRLRDMVDRRTRGGVLASVSRFFRPQQTTAPHF